VEAKHETGSALAIACFPSVYDVVELAARGRRALYVFDKVPLSL